MNSCKIEDDPECENKKNNLENIIKDWGYSPLLPENVIEWPILPQWMHIMVGVILLILFVNGIYWNWKVLKAYWKLPSENFEVFDFLTINHILANLGIIIFQCPFTAVSSFNQRWIFGDSGCQLYGTVGFFFGIGSILSLCLLSCHLYSFMIDREIGLKKTVFWTFLQWIFTLVLIAPPTLGVAGRFYMEPSGTGCTIDFWHQNFRFYDVYIMNLTLLGFVLPISVGFYYFLRAAKAFTDETEGVRSEQDPKFQKLGHLKFVGYSFLASVICWTPFAVVCIWPLVLGIESVNITLTLIPPLAAKVYPSVSSYLALAFLPKTLPIFNFNSRRMYVVTGTSNE